ncbi:MAG: rhodanese-like domain-containing protein [Saprospiraceae bacterium]|nr:rhodanese-like domain-containing protein [Saprospiraceae bacterium]
MKQLTHQAFDRWRKERVKFVLIDVREKEEHESYNVGGYLVPLSNLKTGYGLLNTSLPVVVYCKRGIRSQIAIQRLRQQFPTTSFYNLKKGILHLNKTS